MSPKGHIIYHIILHLLPLKKIKTRQKAISLRILFLQSVDVMLIKDKAVPVQACYRARVPGG